MAAPCDCVVVVAPRWAGSPTTDWYQSLTASVSEEWGAQVLVHVLDFPNHNSPVVEDEVQFITSELRSLGLIEGHQNQARKLVFVGHSVGNQALVRFLCTSAAEDLVVEGFVAVAGWFSVDADKIFGTLPAWLETYDITPARKRFSENAPVVLIQSDNDPFTSDFEANSRDWKEKLGASSVLVPGAKHFNNVKEPDVFREVIGILRKLLD